MLGTIICQIHKKYSISMEIISNYYKFQQLTYGVIGSLDKILLQTTTGVTSIADCDNMHRMHGIPSVSHAIALFIFEIFNLLTNHLLINNSQTDLGGSSRFGEGKKVLGRKSAFKMFYISVH